MVEMLKRLELSENVSKLFSILPVLSLLVVSGCGSNVRGELNETEEITAHVLSLGDAAGDEASFQEFFVEGAAPENREEYATSIFEISGEPSVSGNEAEVTVKVTPGAAAGNLGDSAAKQKSGDATGPSEVTWTLKKDGDQWKIQDAPLK